MRFISLRTKLIVASLLLILFPIMGVGIYGYHEIEQVLRKQMASATTERLRQVNINIAQELSMMVNAWSSMVLDENVQRVLMVPPEGARKQVENVQTIDKKYLEISTAILTDSATITLFDIYGNAYTNWPKNTEAIKRIRDTDWYQEAEAAHGYMVWELNHDNYVSPNSNNMTTLVLVIRDRSLINEIGVLVISKPVANYLNILNSNSEDQLNFIMDKEGNFLTEISDRMAQNYSAMLLKLNKSRDSFTTDINGETAEVITNTIDLTDWKVVQVIPHKEIFEEANRIRSIMFIIFMISMTFFIAIIIVISFMFTKPLRRLGSTMKQVESGNMNILYNLQSRDEVGLLGKTFNHMLKRLRNHMENEIHLERSKEKAKLEALQAQINPHFLHNTLNTIKWMSMIAGTKDITEMLLSLAHLLNMSISRGQEAITLKEEIENVRYFLTIQKYRFGDTIIVIEEIDPETLDCYVPKLSLQPLVENVYRHGLFINGGKMIIRASRKGEDLYIQVIDEGRGLEKKRIEEINAQMSQQQSDSSFSGIGIKNVHSRIQLMYGYPYGLTIERDEENEITIVSIQIPMKREGLE